MSLQCRCSPPRPRCTASAPPPPNSAHPPPPTPAAGPPLLPGAHRRHRLMLSKRAVAANLSNIGWRTLSRSASSCSWAVSPAVQPLLLLWRDEGKKWRSSGGGRHKQWLGADAASGMCQRCGAPRHCLGCSEQEAGRSGAAPHSKEDRRRHWPHQAGSGVSVMIDAHAPFSLAT